MKKGFIILLVVLFCLILIAQGVLSVFIKKLAVKELNKLIATEAEIDSMDISLLRGAVSFSGITIKNPDGFHSPQFLTIRKGSIQISLLPLLFKQLQISKIFLDRPNINIEINPAGRGRGLLDIMQGSSVSNTSIIFKRDAPQPEASVKKQPAAKKMPPFKINKIIIRQGAVKFQNYKLSPTGASVALDKIDLTVKNLAPTKDPEHMPTSIKCQARIATENTASNIELTADGAFLSKAINFDLDLAADNIPLTYFSSFYADKVPVLIKEGLFNLRSTTKCRNSQLRATQEVDIAGLVVEPKGQTEDNLIFGLPIHSVINLLTRNEGKLSFDFDITGTLTKPKFHLTEALQRVLAKSIEGVILDKASELPGIILDKIEGSSKIDEAGKEILEDIFQKIFKK
ncbi:MAG: DUF748 domain-containing protein [Candidatus Omnitrophica bacterium]|nr:DUF748 domain-containing protein [Candidatus Omnitrophota bacterium]